MAQNLNLEVYEFLLKDYPYKYALNNSTKNSNVNIQVKTLSINSSEINECGLVQNRIHQSARDDITLNPNIYDSKTVEEPYHENIRSCDPINSVILTTQNNISLRKETDDAYKYSFKLFDIESKHLIKFSSIWGAKNTGIDFDLEGVDPILIKDPELFDKTPIEFFCPSMNFIYDLKVYDILDKVMLMLKDDWYSETINLRNTKISKEKNSIIDNHTLIKKINANVEDKFIIIGDIHGSYASFIRILLRLRKMDIMDEECNLLNNHHLIFLGDIVDRGQYGYEVIILIFLLKIQNPDCVHINRGNHEDIEINRTNGFLNELKSKFEADEGENVHTYLNNIFCHQHSALLIKNPINNKYTYLAHGGLPTRINTYELEPTFKNFDNEFNIILENLTINNINAYEYMNPNTGMMENYSGINTIRWNDFWGYQNSIDTEYRAIKIGQDIINKLLNDQINIELIIRAHQDSNYNTKLLQKINLLQADPSKESFININKYQAFGIVNPDLTQKIHCYKFTHLIKVNPAGNLILNEINIPDLLPVVTISTNTDTGRNLSKDSFVILKFTEDYNPALDGCAVVNSDEEKIIKKNRILDRIVKVKDELELLKLTYSLDYDELDEYKIKLKEYDRLIADPMVKGFVHGGNYYEKYMKYKAKYLALKKLNI
jgi:hypothetical protein